MSISTLTAVSVSAPALLAGKGHHPISLMSFSQMIATRVNYAGRVRQKSARVKEAPDRDRTPHGSAPEGRGKLQDDAGKPYFLSFAGCRSLRVFENRAKAPTD